eukprot:scaffold1590_cov239-Pinguiococcus_pyrenoidosus.AAC.7
MRPAVTSRFRPPLRIDPEGRAGGVSKPPNPVPHFGGMQGPPPGRRSETPLSGGLVPGLLFRRLARKPAPVRRGAAADRAGTMSVPPPPSGRQHAQRRACG